MNIQYCSLDYDFSILKGKIIRKIIYTEIDKRKIIFEISDDESYIMHHLQDCCEKVNIEEISGDLQWIIGSPILLAESRSNQDDPKYDPKDDDHGFGRSHTWTFYEIATINGSVTIRWYGFSNGYYSESVDFNKIIH